jgi:hypothetical protein
VQSIDMPMHEPSGVQSLPWAHVVHEPLKQTPPSHETPFVTLVVATHWDAPPSHSQVPFWHGDGEQAPMHIGASDESAASLGIESVGPSFGELSGSVSLSSAESGVTDVSFGTVASESAPSPPASIPVIESIESGEPSRLPPSVVASLPESRSEASVPD